MSEEPKPRRVTLVDVAREAGVSVQTASHVLAATSTVKLPEATRARVREAAEKVGYRPNRLAQAMKRGRTNAVCIWMPLSRMTPVYMSMLREFHEAASESDYDLMIASLDLTTAFTTHGKLPPVWAVDGLISIDAGKAIGLLREDRHYDDLPAVILGYESFANTDSVGWEILGAARRAVRTLVDRGCRRIVFLTPAWLYDDYPNERRRRGYSDAMNEAGLPLEIMPVPDEGAGGAETAVLSALRLGEPPDAYFAFNDAIAIGAARAVLAHGLSIPGDVKIWGYGGHPESADFKIPISTTQAPVHQIVRQAWDWLMERMANPALPPRFTEFDVTIIDRESAQ